MALGGLLLSRPPGLRTCVGCRGISPKADLVRVVDGPNGRGAYVHPRETCIDAATKGGAAKALRRQVSAEEIRKTIVKNSAGLRHAEEVETASRPPAGRT